MSGENIIQEKSYAFALRVIRLYKHLAKERGEYILGQQILKSGTSIGANIEEAIQAESRADFIHKLSIANKEAHETKYWIKLLIDSETVKKDTASLSLLDDCVELIKLLTAILKTSKKQN
ncbi:MAG: four helix bundle protein [Desulfobulbaceae bacterium]|nr:four helix bundle protein [Desulfobulbaceae bacterium]